MLKNVVTNNIHSLGVNHFEEHLTLPLQQHIMQIISQVKHDIQSPLTCLLFLCTQQETNNLKIKIDPAVSISRINSIINSIPQAIHSICNNNTEIFIQPVLILNSIEKILAEKQFEYATSDIIFTFDHTIEKNNVYINTNSDAFERMLSNLINNAVEACSSKSGIVSLNLGIAHDTAYLSIADNGIGMPDNVKNKILNNVAITNNKLNGHGIGFQQIRKTLAFSGAKLNIESTLGVGTKIILTFPISKEEVAFVKSPL